MQFISTIVTLILVITQLIFLSVLANVELPLIPPRPTIEELKKSLDIVPAEVKIKNLPANKIRFKTEINEDRQIINSKRCDNLLEKSLNLNVAQLFSLSLNAVKSLNLSLKYFDSNTGEIIASDMLRNTFFVQVVTQDNKENKVRILGYGSKVGKFSVDRTLKKLLAEISEQKT